MVKEAHPQSSAPCARRTPVGMGNIDVSRTLKIDQTIVTRKQLLNKKNS
jgi:hypothetical protein